MKAWIAIGLLALAGCVSKYEGTHSDFETYQVGNICYTRGHGEIKVNLPGQMPEVSCACNQLRLVKRIVVKAGQSPEVLACPTPREYMAGDTFTAQAVVHHPTADKYVDAAGHALEGAFIGAGIGAGLAAQQAPKTIHSMTGGGFGPNYISTFNGGAGAIPGLPNGR